MKIHLVPADFQFLFVGRLLYDKGIVEFVEAAKDILSHHSNVSFMVIGELDNQNPAAIKPELLSHWQQSGLIQYQNKVSNIKPFIAKADVVVLPSYREGLPRVMLEGMSMAKPLITSDVPGCRETVIHEKNGFLVPPKNSTQLANAMKKMLHLTPSQRHLMGQEGRKIALKRFDEKHIVHTYTQVITSLLQQKNNNKRVIFPKPILSYLRGFISMVLVCFFGGLLPTIGNAQVKNINLHSGTTIFGYNGNIVVPSAYLHPDKTLNIGISHLPPEVPFQGLGAAESNGGRLLFGNITFLPFMEFTFAFNKPYTAEDPTDIGLGDRQISARFQLIKESKHLPALVLGLHDPFTKSSYVNTNYLVASKKVRLQKELSLMTHVGYGIKFKDAKDHYLLGAFGGAALEWKFLQASLEYDADHLNAGVKANIKNRVFLQAALLDMQYVSASVNIRFRL